METPKKRRVFYTGLERSQKAAAERLLADPAALPSHRATALRTLRTVQTAAEDRAFDRALADDETTDPNVDDLVSALEKAEKQPLQVQQNKEPEKAPNATEAILAPPTAAKASEVTATPETAPTAFCGFCSAAGPWNTRYPVGQEDGVLLCSVCFSKMCASEARQNSAAALARQNPPVRSWLYEKGTDPNTNDISDLRGMNRDYQNSVALWEQQARDDADRQAQEAQERERAEAQFHASRARWIQDGGRL